MIQSISKNRIEKMNSNKDLIEVYDFVSQIYSEKELKFKREEHFSKEFLKGVYFVKNEEEIKGYFALYQNPNLKYKGKTTLCIGNYECVDDVEISFQIVDFCRQKAKQLEAEFLIAPMNGSTWNEYRFLDFDTNESLEQSLEKAFFLEPIHQKYYANQFLEANFEPISSYFSFLDTEMNYGNTETLKQKKRLENENVIIRNIDIENFETELERLFPFVSELFKDNFLYTSISLESFKDKYLPIKPLIHPNYVLMAEHKNEVVGFIFCYPNIYSTNQKQLVCKTIGRHHNDFYKGLGHVMTHKVARQAKKDGFSAFIHAFMIKDSLSSELSSYFAKHKHRTYTLYGMEIE